MENKKPIFRFKNHVEGWKSLTLGEVSEIKTGPFGSTLHAKDYVESGTPIITTEHFKFGELPDTKLNTPQVSESDYQRLSSYKLIKGDIVFSRVGSVDINALVGDLQNGWLFSGRVLRVRPQVNVDSEYLHYLLETTSVKNDVLSRAVGQTMPSINTEILKKTNITMSINVSEQKSIGEFLRSVDKIIKIHQQELETLKQTKQGFLQKMFPKEGEMVPEVRFNEFDKDWKAYKLGELGNTFTGLSGKTKDDFGHGSAEFVTYMNVFSNPISNLKMTENVEIDAKQNAIKYGDVLFTTSSETPREVGMSSVWLDNRENVYLNSFCFGFRPTFNVNPLYLAYLLRSNSIREQMILLAQGISRYNISKTKVMDITVKLPSEKEQLKIGEFFKKLDKTIELHEQELEALKETKKAFLQKMFV